MITVFTLPNCPNCVRAKTLLEANDMEYTTVEINAQNRSKLILAGARSAPALFQDDVYFGGYKELKAFFKAQKEEASA